MGRRLRETEAICGKLVGRTEDRCVRRGGAQGVCDPGVRARFIPGHNRDASGIGPRRLGLPVLWSGHAIKGAAAYTRVGDNTLRL
jgi:hypothetical protein